MSFPSQENLLTVEALAERLALSPRTLRNWLYRGTCPIRPIRLGAAVRFDPRDVQAVIDALRAPAQAQAPATPSSPRRGRGRPRKDLTQQPRG